VLIAASVGDYGYADSLPDNITSFDDIFTFTPIVEDSFEGKVNENIAFKADLESGEPSDYEWVWAVQDGDFLYGQNPSKSFSQPGNYSGVLYVYNEEEFGKEFFFFDVAGSPTSKGGAGDNDSGSALMIFAIIIAIIVIAGIAVVFFVIRR
ncbi:unnamed protein product, partial [marine sediment metagenome]